MRKIKTYKLFESKESVEHYHNKVVNLCNKYGIRNWKLNPDGTVDVDGDVNFYNKRLTELPLKFGKVTGYFDCSNNKLTSLEGCPNWVGVSFNCFGNNLKTLEGGPNWVGGYFNCGYNKLTNLEGCPSFVDGNFWCSDNKLTNLEGCPEKIYGDLNCQRNKIISLDHYPTILTGRLFTYDNPIYEIWENVWYHNPNNHGVLLELFWLNNPVRFENGEWVCYREFLDNFFEEIDVPSPPKLKNYKEV